MKTQSFILRVIFLPIVAIILVTFAIHPVYSMISSDEDEENDYSSHSSHQKRNSNSDDAENDDIHFTISLEENEFIRLLASEIWGPTAIKLFREALQQYMIMQTTKMRNLFDPLKHKDDLKMLLDAVTVEPLNPATRPSLAKILACFEDKEALEAANRLNSIIALDNSLSLKDRKTAIKSLERTDSPENKKIAYEARTIIAKDKSLSFENRYRFAKHFLFLHNIEDLKHAIEFLKKFY